jgi:hypothetical protein
VKKSFNEQLPARRQENVVNRLPSSRPTEFAVSAGAPLPAASASPRAWFSHRLTMESETCWLLLFGVLDLILTTVLLNTGRVQEANPVARYFLFAGGLHGLIGYKCALLAFVTVTVQIIALRRPRTARGVLLVGILAHVFVVSYSTVLLVKVA